MKALSLRQPWAEAVLHGKTVENRHWNTKFRGEFLIHAAKGCTEAEYDDALIWIAFEARNNMIFPDWKDLPRGGIVGRARLIDVIHPFTEQIGLGSQQVWWMREQFGFILTDIRRTPFIACKGALGFWNVPETVLTALARAA